MKVTLKNRKAEEPEVVYSEDVKQQLHSMGILLAVADPLSLKKDYSLPEDITRLPSASISKLMASCANQHAYILSQMALRSVELCRKGRIFERRKAVILSGCSERNKYRSEAVCSCDKQLQSLEDEYDLLEGIIEMMKAVSDGLKEKASVLSRELSRRQAEAGLAGKL